MRILNYLFIKVICILIITVGWNMASADVYQWVDEDGTVHIEDGVPQGLSKSTKVRKIRLRESNPQMNDAKDAAPAKNPVAKQSAAANPTVEIFTTSWCPYCKQAKKYLSDKGIAFTEYDVEVNREASKRKNNLSPNSGVPVAVINGKVIKGFSADAYDRAFAQQP